MTREKMIKIIQDIPELEIDNGICEFYQEGNMSIGVSYEHIGLGTHYVGYIFNLFLGDEYININGIFDNLIDVVDVLVEEWNRIKTKFYRREIT